MSQQENFMKLTSNKFEVQLNMVNLLVEKIKILQKRKGASDFH